MFRIIEKKNWKKNKNIEILSTLLINNIKDVNEYPEMNNREIQRIKITKIDENNEFINSIKQKVITLKLNVDLEEFVDKLVRESIISYSLFNSLNTDDFKNMKFNIGTTKIMQKIQFENNEDKI